jgi:hypothetical protein
MPWECLRAERCRKQKVKSSRNLTLWDPYISCAKLNPLRTLRQIKGVQDLHNLLCAYYAGRKVFEPEGSKESCLASTTLKITSRMAKRGQAPVRLIIYIHAPSAAIILCWTID